jgi:hypothetical protein
MFLEQVTGTHSFADTVKGKYALGKKNVNVRARLFGIKAVQSD